MWKIFRFFCLWTLGILEKKGWRKIVKVIETNLSLDNNNIIDHQSRIVEVNSWEDYCKAFQKYKGDSVGFKSLTLMKGETLQRNCSITNFMYDEFHLSCDILKGKIRTKRLAYLVIE